MDKTIVITGTSSGIGKALAFYCVEQGYHVINICRKSDKSIQFYNELEASAKKNEPDIIFGDLSLKQDIDYILSEIRGKTDRIDLLINNAGVLKLKESYSEEGIEMTMAVNIIAVYRLTEGLLQQYDGFDIINVTSELFKKGKIVVDEIKKPVKYNGSQRYNDSKKAQLYYTYELSNRLKATAKVIAIHPGVVATNAFREYPKIVMKLMNIFLQKPSIAAQKIMEPFQMDVMEDGHYYSQNKKVALLNTFVDEKQKTKLINYLESFESKKL